MAQPLCQLNTSLADCQDSIRSLWISWNKIRPRLTRVISPKPWSLGGRFSVCQSWCCGFVADPRPLVCGDEVFETYLYRKALKIPWTDTVKNNQVLDRMDTERQLIKFKKQRKLTFAGYVMRGSAEETLMTLLNGKLQGKRSRGRKRQGYTDDLKQWTGRHEEMKRMAEEVWRDRVAHPQ
ncbi:hypothetical protein LAZ67_14000657 [Cordylochernes scorpioides]|uniref:Uncharacterized protein n=1 Tax=Cordylochernes scorpioides TaxID=51811 RepID=A0ABY6L6T7_9ARAC|nr:hypothetical protein LAZ67_14000657 [Cordylochernes scorpioides]